MTGCPRFSTGRVPALPAAQEAAPLQVEEPLRVSAGRGRRASGGDDAGDRTVAIEDEDLVALAHLVDVPGEPVTKLANLGVLHVASIRQERLGPFRRAAPLGGPARCARR